MNIFTVEVYTGSEYSESGGSYTTLIAFLNEEDAKNFKNVLDKYISKLQEAYKEQREFLDTLSRDFKERMVQFAPWYEKHRKKLDELGKEYDTLLGGSFVQYVNYMDSIYIEELECR